MTHIIHKDLSYAVKGVLFDVHNALGPMLAEKFYQAAIAIGLEAKGIRCETEKSFEVYYRDARVGLYFVDMWIEDGNLLLELKVAPEITAMHQAQTLSYLKVIKPVWLYPDLTRRLFEALYRIHFELGPGFLHQVYRRATMVELQHQDIGYRYIKTLPVAYRGHLLGEHPARLINVEDKILLATFAVQEIEGGMEERLRARLRLLGLKLGFLANFNDTTLQILPVRTA